MAEIEGFEDPRVKGPEEVRPFALTPMPLTPLAPQFETPDQQREAVHLGMWSFLATEILFFGGLFTAYCVYRMKYPLAFAEASHHLYFWLGALNTALLLGSSWTMAMGVHFTSQPSPADSSAANYFRLTAFLGLMFLVVKGVEYAFDFREGLSPGAGFQGSWATDPEHSRLFFVLYFIMTAVHAVHMTIGVGLVSFMAVVVRHSAARYANAVEMVGLYWHFVDIIWIFLFPLLYMVTE